MLPPEILEKAAKDFGVSQEMMLSESRINILVRARDYAASMMKQEGYSYQSIAILLNRKSHTSSLRGSKRHEDLERMLS